MKGRFRSKHGIGWWNLSGLAAAASAGRSELDARGMKRVVYDSPRYGVTVVIASDERAAELREWFAATTGERGAVASEVEPEPAEREST